MNYHLFKETRVIADTLNGKKSGEIKFIRSAEFAEGEWIGVALDEPTGEFAVLHVIVTILGKNNGSINGRQCFNCKNKYRLYVGQDKIKSQ